MVMVITRNKVKSKDKYMELASGFVKDLRLEQGCVEADMVSDTESEDEVLFVSKWESKDLWAAHLNGKAFSTHIPKLGEFYISGVDEFYTVF